MKRISIQKRSLEREREKYGYQGQRNENKNEGRSGILYFPPLSLILACKQRSRETTLPQTFPRVHATETSFRSQLSRPCFFFSPFLPRAKLYPAKQQEKLKWMQTSIGRTRRPLVDPRFVFLNFNPFRHL